MTPSDSVVQLARSSNKFGFDLYQRLRESPGNLVLSPASLMTALVMTWGGARGETADQMRSVLHLEGSDDEVLAAAGELAKAIQDSTQPLSLNIANRLFAEQTYPLREDFLEKTEQAFGAGLEALDFLTQHQAARQRINQWVEERTQGRIQNLIPDGGTNPLTRLVLTNAIYFLADWLEPFDKAATHPAPFHLSRGEEKPVATMHRMGVLRISRQAGFAAVELPYKGGRWCMLVLVPDEIEGLAAVEAGLDASALERIVEQLRHEEIDLALPKLEVNPRESLVLSKTLAPLGMPLAFDEWNADFGGISASDDPRQGLFIAEAFHKGFLKVDEKGTEAAAATAVVMRGRGMPARLIEIKADRPFLLVIRDKESGLVLFLGRVSDPESS